MRLNNFSEVLRGADERYPILLNAPRYQNNRYESETSKHINVSLYIDELFQRFLSLQTTRVSL